MDRRLKAVLVLLGLFIVFDVVGAIYLDAHGRTVLEVILIVAAAIGALSFGYALGSYSDRKGRR